MNVKEHKKKIDILFPGKDPLHWRKTYYNWVYVQVGPHFNLIFVLLYDR